MVAYKVGDIFSILRCHEFIKQRPIRKTLDLPEFDVSGLYRAVETLERNKEPIVIAFRRMFLDEFGTKVMDTVFGPGFDTYCVFLRSHAETNATRFVRWTRDKKQPFGYFGDQTQNRSKGRLLHRNPTCYDCGHLLVGVWWEG